MTDSEWVQIILMGLLVGVTIFYAWQARRTVSEMKEQRLAAKPFVIPDIDIHIKHRDYTEKTKEITQGNFPVVLTNVGTASAIELELLLITPSNVIVSSKLPLLLPSANWRSDISYVHDFTEEGEPIFDDPPPEGKYNLIVKFKSAAHQENQVYEVSLPFDLHYPQGIFGLSIIRGKLFQKTLGGK